MKKLLIILLLIVGCALAITTEDIYDNSYALLIGINKYENVKNLNYAVADAESIHDILVNTFNFPEGNITLLKNEEANKDAILKAFSDLTNKLKITIEYLFILQDTVKRWICLKVVKWDIYFP